MYYYFVTTMYILNFSTFLRVHWYIKCWIFFKGQGAQELAIEITENTSIHIKYEFSLWAFRAMQYFSDFSSLLGVEALQLRSC